MTHIKMNFGFYPHHREITGPNFYISSSKTIEDYPAIKDLVDSSGWIINRKGPARIFDLPKNAILGGDFESEAQARFIVQCLGFFEGIKLTSINYEYIDAVNIKRDFLGFSLNKNDILIALDYALKFWDGNIKKNSSKQNEILFGIIHLLFLSQIPTYLGYEKFLYLYIAIDACYNCLAHDGQVKAKTHSKRIEAMCKKFNITFPKSHYEADFIKVRNQFFHEGLYNDKAVGYSRYKPNPLFLQNFVCRLIFIILRIPVSGLPPICEHLDTFPINIASEA